MRQGKRRALRVTAYATVDGETQWEKPIEVPAPSLGIDLIEIDHWTPTTFTLGKDDPNTLISREIDTLVCPGGKPVERQEFWYAFSRLRRRGVPLRIICEKDSAYAEWFKEMVAKVEA